MPELPEVEIVRRGMDAALCGQKITCIDVWRKNIRTPVPKNLKSVLEGCTINKFIRRGKYIVALTSGDYGLGLHLGMSGKIKIYKEGRVYDREKHDHFCVTMHDGSRAVFNDARRFGMLFLVNAVSCDKEKPFNAMGPEPLEKPFNGKVLAQALKGKKTPIKTALLDQRVVAGVGNIYACEALFNAGISPLRPAGALTADECAGLAKEIQVVLKKAIRAGGSSLRDYRNTKGDLGYFQHHFEVYDREGKPCTGCTCKALKTGGVQRIVQAGRSTFYCPVKQR